MPLVTFGQDDQLGEIVIDNPPLNLFNADMLSDLRSAVEQAAHSDIRAVLVRAEGNDFSAGADVSVLTRLDHAGGPRDSFFRAGRAFAKAPVTGPTRAHAVTNGARRAWRAGGVAAADPVTRAEGPNIMMSQDLQDGLASLVPDGIGHATFHNR